MFFDLAVTTTTLPEPARHHERPRPAHALPGAVRTAYSAFRPDVNIARRIPLIEKRPVALITLPLPTR